jgi:ATP-dependent Clp protease ATP-binding subunit ClpB
MKRAVDRNLVHPLSNLIATGQVRGGDLIRVDFDTEICSLTFFKDAEDMPAYVMARMVDTSIAPPAGAYAAGAVVETVRTSNSAKSTKR